MAEETNAGAGQADEPHFGEIRRMLDDLPEIDRDAAHTAGHAILPGSGRLAALARFLAGWQGRPTPQMTHPRLTLFAASHGAAAALGIDPVAVSEAAVQRFLDGVTPLNRLAESLDSDLRVYELSVELASADFSAGPALEEADCARAMTYGMIAVEPGIDVLALASISAESDLPAAALATLLLGGMAADWCGPSADPARLALIDKAVSLHAGTRADPLEALRCLGGLDIAAMAGAILACRFARTPVLNQLMKHITPRSMIERSLRETVSNKSIVTDQAVDRYWELLRYPGNRDATRRRFSGTWSTFDADDAATIAVPTLVIWGEEDALIPVEAGLWYDTHLPDSRLVVYPGIGHLPQEEVAERSSAYLLTWLNEQGVRSAVN